MSYTYVPAGKFVPPCALPHGSYYGSLKSFLHRDTGEGSRLLGFGVELGRVILWKRFILGISGMLYGGFYELRGEKLFLGEELQVTPGVEMERGNLRLIPAVNLSIGSEMGPYLWDATDGEELYRVYSKGNLLLLVSYSGGTMEPFLYISVGSLESISIGVMRRSGIHLRMGLALPSSGSRPVMFFEIGMSTE